LFKGIGLFLGNSESLYPGNVILKGLADKVRYYLPRSKAVKFDGHKLWFEVSKDQAKAAYRHDADTKVE
jgi:hypothetical protein